MLRRLEARAHGVGRRNDGGGDGQQVRKERAAEGDRVEAVGVAAGGLVAVKAALLWRGAIDGRGDGHARERHAVGQAEVGRIGLRPAADHGRTGRHLRGRDGGRDGGTWGAEGRSQRPRRPCVLQWQMQWQTKCGVWQSESFCPTTSSHSTHREWVLAGQRLHAP